MPRFTALVWNLEQYGTKFQSVAHETQGLRAQALELLRARLVAAIVAAAEADVVVIQEFREPARIVLPALVATVQAARERAAAGDWLFDWLPSAWSSVDTPTGFDDLGFGATANHEGYAVIWREGALARLDSRLSAGVSATVSSPRRSHFISLVLAGGTLAFDATDDPPITFAAPTTALGFPPSTCPIVGSNIQTRGTPIGHSSNEVIASMRYVRRPCVVMLAPVRTPLVTYHAPVGQNSSRSDYYGTLIGFAADALQGQRAAYAGDFNVVSQPNQRSLYARSVALDYDVSTFVQRGSTGPIEPLRSVVHYVNHAGDGYRRGSAVLGSARDYAFLRNHETDGTTLVYDALGALKAALGDSQRLRASVATISQNWTEVIAEIEVGAIVRAFLAGESLPDGTDENTALAIIYRELISDHLPVALRYTVTD
ncbi:MAG: hypothetical protein R6X02_14455 [Enhygromyxa sp.]